MTKTNLGLYVHIPFCERKCNYCDFNSGCYSKITQRKYLDSLLSEIKLESNFYNNYIVDTIFIGGGTPSLLSAEEITQIVESIYENFNISNDTEFTIEANPNSIDLDKLKIYKKLNINRLSIGAQSFINKELDLLGRIHKADDITKAIRLAKEAGFDNINLDLMTSIPKQTFESFSYSLNNAIALDIQHISIYSLIIEEGTPFGEMHSKGKSLNLMSEDEDRKIYHSLKKILNKSKFNQYEISNYAKFGFECRHNIKYWQCDDYLGIGLGAHSKVLNTRIENIDSILDYINNLNNRISSIKNKYSLSKLDRLNEKIIMGIRMNRGLCIKDINKDFGMDFEENYSSEINKNIKNGYIEIVNNFIKLTDLGLDFSNIVELDFYRLED
ncbi:MAG: radical SAM family heme chaperone HemW [Tissierellia bacterium]|nr:radical SAM family heme chaperone HemW [Tissierellia bacterium]